MLVVYSFCQRDDYSQIVFQFTLDNYRRIGGGPVLPVLRYSDLDDAIARANDSEYGLGGTVWGKDTKRAFDVAQRIASGTVWVNKHLELAPDIPFGGAKQSGFGTEMGQEGLEEFTQSRIVNIAK